MEQHQHGTHGRSRVHFNAENRDDEEGVTVNVASFDPDGGSGEEDEEKKSGESVQEEEDGQSKDITEFKKGPSSFYFEESEEEEEDGEQPRSPQETEQINRFLRFKSPSAPTSPQSSPLRSPTSIPQHRSSDIPLLELNSQPHTRSQQRLDSRRSSTGTVIGHSEKRSARYSLDAATLGKREADRLVKEHSQRAGPKDFCRRLSSGDGLRSGTSTPDPDDDHSKHYTFNSGVLTNLLKLYTSRFVLA